MFEEEQFLRTHLKKFKKGGKNGEYISCCIFHQDSKPSLGINLIKGVYSCFSCRARGTVRSLLTHLGYTGTYTKRNYHPIIEKPKPVKIDLIGELRDIHTNDNVMQYCYSRGMTENFLETFKITHYFRQAVINKVVYENRLIIPITDNKQLVSMELRDFTGKQERKALYPVNTTVSSLWNNGNLDVNKPLIVVEGIMDTVKIYEYITHNITCPFGIKLTNTQKELLKKFKKTVVFPDDDKGGYEFIENFQEFMDKDFYVTMVKGKDPGDASIAELNQAIKSTKLVTEFIIDQYKLF